MNDSVADALIVGAGPVGLALSIGLARHGLCVTVVDRATVSIDKACGEGLMPRGVEALQRLGVDSVGLGGRHFPGIRYVDGEVEAEGRFSHAPGVALRRTTLQEALYQQAQRRGVDLELETVVRGISEEGVDTDKGLRRARWIIGADGLHSCVRRWSGLERGPRGGRFGVRRHYAIESWTEFVEVHWADRCEAYITPLGGREICVAMLWEGRKAGFDDHLARFPRIEARLVGADRTSRDLGAGPLEQRVRRVHQGRVALVGDASGYVDAITGEGLTVGFLQAEALTEALLCGDLPAYARAHRRIGRRLEWITRRLLAIERRPALRRWVIRMLAEHPSLFDRLLEVYVGGAAPRSYRRRTAGRDKGELNWRFGAVSSESVDDSRSS